jgi:uncharacterized membrane protein
VVFLAFATIFPRYPFRLMFAISVPAYVFGLGIAIIGLGGLIGAPLYLLYALVSLFPFTFWAGPILVGYLTNRATTHHRRAKFQAKVQSSEDTAFHTCATCGATDETHPDRDFRMTAEDIELCSKCLPDE